MSRIGKKVIPVPKGVAVKIAADAVEVKGPKGALRQPLPPGIGFEMADGELRATTATEDKALGKFHGLARSLVANAVQGVTEGFKRELDIVGVGYRAEVKGREVHFALGYSHPIAYQLPAGITAKVDRQVVVTLEGADRELLGQVASQVRGLRPPEPYKGKGIRYAGEYVQRKVGKRA